MRCRHGRVCHEEPSCILLRCEIIREPFQRALRSRLVESARQFGHAFGHAHDDPLSAHDPLRRHQASKLSAERAQGRRRVGGTIERREEVRLNMLTLLVDECREELFLILEIDIERPLRDPGLARNVADAGRVKSEGREDASRAIEDLAALFWIFARAKPPPRGGLGKLSHDAGCSRSLGHSDLFFEPTGSIRLELRSVSLYVNGIEPASSICCGSRAARSPIPERETMSVEPLKRRPDPQPAPSGASAAAEAATPTVSRKKLALTAGAALLALVGLWKGYDYVTVGRFTVSTDDAYVGAENAQIASKLPGHVAAVLVEANQKVRAGDPLIRIDETDYRFALDQAQAKLATQQATLARIGAEAVAADAGVAQANAQARAAEAEVTRAAAAYERSQKLAATDFASRAALENATADRDRTLAQKAAADAAVANATAQRALVDARLSEARGTAKELAVAVDRAKRDLESTTITAPFDGLVAAKSVQQGDYVQPGKRMLSLVPVDRVYVDANFKETQIAGVTPGQKVEVTVDAYPGRVFEGTVVGLAAGTGSTFSLLPPDNATGNFTKIVQRVPVRIAVTQSADGALLRPGMSVVASINTRKTER